MDSQIKQLKQSLQRKIEEILNHNHYFMLKERCLNAVSCLVIFKTSIQNATHRKALLKLYDQFLTSLDSRNIQVIESKLEELTRAAAHSITLPLSPVLDYLTRCLEMCRNYKVNNLSEIIGYVIGCSIYEAIKEIHDFQTCWEMCLENTFVTFNMTHKGNKFLKDIIAFNLCGEIKNEYRMAIDHSKLPDIGKLLFGDVKNYKFFKKACYIYQEFQGTAVQSIQNPQNLQNISIICSKLARDHENNQSILKIGQNFQISPTGSATSNRLDRLVLFGKHPLCDIRLPNDENIDDISFAIYHNTFTYLVLDCSKKSFLKRKLPGFEVLRLTSDLILDIAEVALMRIINFTFSQNDNTGEIDGILMYEFLTGELSKCFGGNTKKLMTLQRDGSRKEKFLLGKGQFGVVADICLSGGQMVGRSHMFFEFVEQNWIAYDAESKNGSFVLFKNHGQLKDESFSACCSLMQENRVRIGVNSQGDDDSSTCLSLRGYSFLFKLS